MRKFGEFLVRERQSLLVLYFGHALLLRFLFPFLYSPLDHIWSDPARHWENGARFFSNPHFMNGVDAKFYQLFIWAVQQIGSIYQPLILVCSGLLCAGGAWIWYKAARELMAKTPALIVALIIALHPSLLLIYSYFMTETLAIPLMGLGIWMTLRARRKQTPNAFLLATFVWILGMHTRSILIPAALLSFCFMLAFLKTDRLKTLCIAGLIFATITLPAAVYTHGVLRVFSPFAYSGQNTLYHYSGARWYKLNILDEANYGWVSPTMDSRPLKPFSDYATYRELHPNPHEFTFRKTDGAKVWDAEIARLKAVYTWDMRWKDIRDNMVFFTFGHSWPDSSKIYEGANRPLWEWNYTLRWTWPLIICAVLVLFPFLKQRQETAYILGIIFCTTLLIYFQSSGVMEGRYRKPIEPLLILAVPLLWQALKNKKGEYPLTHFLKLAPIALGFPKRSILAAAVPHGISAPDIRPTNPSTRTANPRRKTTVKKAKTAPKTEIKRKPRKSILPEK